MFRFYRWLFNLVGFSRSQSNGFLIMMPLMMLILISNPIYEMLAPNAPVSTDDARKLDSLVALFQPDDTVSSLKQETAVAKEPIMFRFDPNLISEQDLVRLGVNKKTALRIVNYRKKGGVFRRPNDLAKIYGIDSAFVRRALPFITIKTESSSTINKHSNTRENEGTNVVKASISFDLNAVDSVGLKAIRGIGAKLSVRIIKYRESLGGFVRPDQIFEVYKLDSAVAAEVIKRSYLAADFRPVRLNLNKTDVNQLATHPYISNKVARSIVAYRLKHGEFRAVEDLRQVQGVDSATMTRLQPYLTVSEQEQ